MTALRTPAQEIARDAASRDFLPPRGGGDLAAAWVQPAARAGGSARSVAALAYASGRPVFAASSPAPAAARHLAHEAWHVVQQAQGRVRPAAAPFCADAPPAPPLRAAAPTIGAGGNPPQAPRLRPVAPR